MKKFTQVTGVGAVLPLDNIDTDQISPGHTMMKLQASGYGNALFANWRYLPDGSLNPDFILNRPPFDQSAFLIAGHNFGCGSSREWAVWAIRDFGIRAVIAPSFGATFYRNSFNNAILPLALPEAEIAQLSKALASGDPTMSIDLEAQVASTLNGYSFSFSISGVDRARLIGGLDQIGVTLLKDAKVASFQESDRCRRPWIYEIPNSAP